ncbi:cytochrome P450 family protein [Rhizoctonia solani AG-3 Rhs1AP]|uniref:Cytochrome P450 family protein n=1 Tax=Rhizoctonia solani AG-3 Rhs1AP TaxID=1086054 RepID=X8JGM4_9AGAM|nr:cytochrome P450 family protein [Rhizoctonia solani AG-3 Rhs1AP]
MLLLLSLVLFVHRLIGRSKARLPPRPKSYPLIGSVLSIPSAPEQLAFMELGRQLKLLADIVSLNVFGQDMVILNSAKAATDTLEKRSAAYADRAFPPMVEDPRLMDWSTNVATMRYGDRWRHNRRMFNEWLSARAVTQFHTMQQNQVRSMLRRLLGVTSSSHPYVDVRNEFFYSMASTMFQLSYGYETQGQQDLFITQARAAVEAVSVAGMYSNFLVNFLPVLSYLPTWLPGMSWKRKALEYKDLKNQALNGPYKWAESQVAAGTAKPSILNLLLQDHPLTLQMSPEEKELALKELGFAFYAAGTDTTSNTLVSFVAAMVAYPHVQQKAQDEIDSVLGTAVLPEMADRERLPYVSNLIKELFRWYPALPLALPHAVFADDNYRGYDIGKGTTVAISHDEAVYNDPDTFNPDRYLDPNMPMAPVFGWGRRKCPGSHFADASLFLTITSLLAVFKFARRIGPDGKEIVPKIEPGPNALALSPNPFEFELKVRSEKHRQVILDGAN